MNTCYKILVLFLFALNVFAKDINVYLKFDDPVLHQSIKQFNTYLKAHGIFSRYQIEPFLDNHPLHITLYLATYPETSLPLIQNEVVKLAKKWRRITVKTTHIFVSAGNYVLLDVDNANVQDGSIPQLQLLSDEMTLRLSTLRDFSAKIPDWADAIPEKKKAFTRYGSPNVFFEYNPHVTLMAKNFSDPAQGNMFRHEVAGLIQQHNFQELSVVATAIAIGYVDSFGQVTEEIAHYPL